MKRNFTLFLLLLLGVVTRVDAQLKSLSNVSTRYGCPPLVVTFADASTGSPTAYEWDFDNGNSPTSVQNPSASYATPGVYNVRHIVFNGSSSDTEYILIRVFLPPMVEFAAPDNHGCIEPCHMVNFTNQTIPGESPVTDYVWDFGDGSQPISGLDVAHCYDSLGNFNVTLVARDSNGCQPSVIKSGYVIISSQPTGVITPSLTKSCTEPRLVNFTGSGTTKNPPLVYEYHFGNGNTSALQNPSTIYYSGIYNPYAIVSDSLGCQDTAFAHVEITKVVANFGASTINACQNIPIQFFDSSNFANKWLWDFGDGTTDTVQNPFHTYSTTGTKNVRLTVFYNGCMGDTIKNAFITVTPPFNFTFSGGPVVASCNAPLTVNFTSTGGGSSYLWDFGDSTSSNVQNPSHTYTAKGSYTVTLQAANAQNCVNTKSLTKYISIGDIHASFAPDSTSGCTPLPLTFTSTSTSNPAITNYTWNFGDSTPVISGTNSKVTHVYNKEGLFTVKLYITNATGCKDSAVFSPVKVGARLIPNFFAAPLIQCVDQPVTYTDSTAGVTPLTQFLWNFGDGGISPIENPVHVYRDTGVYTVTLSVINQGCRTDSVRQKYIEIVVPKADFVFTTSCIGAFNIMLRDTSKGADSWLWDFGDGSPTDTAQNPTHAYAIEGKYHITLTVTNATTGCVDSISKDIPIGDLKASFMEDKVSGCYPLPVSFADTSAVASGWLWRFGDGVTSTQKAPIHTYQDTGMYTVSLVITSQGGCRDSIAKPKHITVYGIKANFGINPPIGCIPLTATFNDSSTSYMGTVTSWKWKFGTGNDSSTLKKPQHVYPAVGTYLTSLKVTDSHGCTNAVFQSLQTLKPSASFISDTAMCPGESIRFTNTSQSASTYHWTFGDGGSSDSVNPLHFYAQSGLYTVTMIATSGVAGCKDTVTKVKYLNVDTPVVDFYITSAFAPCPPFPVHFYNTTSRPNLIYTWDFGDGGSSDVKDPLHVYFFPGDYDVTVYAKDSSGCGAHKTYKDLVSIRGPIGNFVVTPDSGCVPLTIQVSGSTKSAVSIVADLGDGTTFIDTINLLHTYTVPGYYYPVYTLTDSLGCKVPYPIDTIVVGLIPYPNLPPDTTVCKGNYVGLNLPYGDHFIWESDQSKTYLICDTCQNTLSQATDTITYYVTAMTNIGCVAKDTITLNVDALPKLSPGVSYRICSGDTLQLDAGKGATSAIWTPALYISDSISVHPKIWPPDTITYRVSAANHSGCMLSRIVKVWPIYNVEGASSLHDTLVCDGYPVQFNTVVTAAAVTDTNYHWSPAHYLDITSVPDPTFSPPPGPGEYDYRIVVSSGHCTPLIDSVHISVRSNPQLQAGDNQIVAVGTDVTLWANSPDADNFMWTSNFDSLSCITCRRPHIMATQTEDIAITVTNEAGCKTSDTISIKVVACDENMVFVPNTFTPNGDDVNDHLLIRGAGLRQLEYFRIYDRYGHLLWQTHNITEGWDGTSAGLEADIATYVYVVKGICSSGATIEKSGNVTLIR